MQEELRKKDNLIGYVLAGNGVSLRKKYS